eukprot:TRINITY_DN1822_c0_g1_i1.p1 TRINITY_DN1822_c0_g1~~TRINITY_DN1822_c0_g1_i1.p1  ORF type:complete len:2148 (-),score=421.65 TRINITY_DN1822_c0_g1_i1:90-6089(-)
MTRYRINDVIKYFINLYTCVFASEIQLGRLNVFSSKILAKLNILLEDEENFLIFEKIIFETLPIHDRKIDNFLKYLPFIEYLNIGVISLVGFFSKRLNDSKTFLIDTNEYFLTSMQQINSFKQIQMKFAKNFLLHGISLKYNDHTIDCQLLSKIKHYMTKTPYILCAFEAFSSLDYIELSDYLNEVYYLLLRNIHNTELLLSILLIEKAYFQRILFDNSTDLHEIDNDSNNGLNGLNTHNQHIDGTIIENDIDVNVYLILEKHFVDLIGLEVMKEKDQGDIRFYSSVNDILLLISRKEYFADLVSQFCFGLGISLKSKGIYICLKFINQVNINILESYVSSIIKKNFNEIWNLYINLERNDLVFIKDITKNLMIGTNSAFDCEDWLIDHIRTLCFTCYDRLIHEHRLLSEDFVNNDLVLMVNCVFSKNYTLATAAKNLLLKCSSSKMSTILYLFCQRLILINPFHFARIKSTQYSSKQNDNNCDLLQYLSYLEQLVEASFLVSAYSTSSSASASTLSNNPQKQMPQPQSIHLQNDYLSKSICLALLSHPLTSIRERCLSILSLLGFNLSTLIFPSTMKSFIAVRQLLDVYGVGYTSKTSKYLNINVNNSRNSSSLNQNSPFTEVEDRLDSDSNDSPENISSNMSSVDSHMELIRKLLLQDIDYTNIQTVAELNECICFHVLLLVNIFHRVDDSDVFGSISTILLFYQHMFEAHCDVVDTSFVMLKTSIYGEIFRLLAAVCSEPLLFSFLPFPPIFDFSQYYLEMNDCHSDLHVEVLRSEIFGYVHQTQICSLLELLHPYITTMDTSFATSFESRTTSPMPLSSCKVEQSSMSRSVMNSGVNSSVPLVNFNSGNSAIKMDIHKKTMFLSMIRSFIDNNVHFEAIDIDLLHGFVRDFPINDFWTDPSIALQASNICKILLIIKKHDQDKSPSASSFQTKFNDFMKSYCRICLKILLLNDSSDSDVVGDNLEIIRGQSPFYVSVIEILGTFIIQTCDMIIFGRDSYDEGVLRFFDKFILVENLKYSFIHLFSRLFDKSKQLTLHLLNNLFSANNQRLSQSYLNIYLHAFELTTVFRLDSFVYCLLIILTDMNHSMENFNILTNLLLYKLVERKKITSNTSLYGSFNQLDVGIALSSQIESFTQKSSRNNNELGNMVRCLIPSGSYNQEKLFIYLLDNLRVCTHTQWWDVILDYLVILAENFCLTAPIFEKLFKLGFSFKLSQFTRMDKYLTVIRCLATNSNNIEIILFLLMKEMLKLLKIFKHLDDWEQQLLIDPLYLLLLDIAEIIINEESTAFVGLTATTMLRELLLPSIGRRICVRLTVDQSLKQYRGRLHYFADDTSDDLLTTFTGHSFDDYEHKEKGGLAIEVLILLISLISSSNLMNIVLCDHVASVLIYSSLLCFDSGSITVVNSAKKVLIETVTAVVKSTITANYKSSLDDFSSEFLNFNGISELNRFVNFIHCYNTIKTQEERMENIFEVKSSAELTKHLNSLSFYQLLSSIVKLCDSTILEQLYDLCLCMGQLLIDDLTYSFGTNELIFLIKLLLSLRALLTTNELKPKSCKVLSYFLSFIPKLISDESSSLHYMCLATLLDLLMLVVENTKKEILLYPQLIFVTCSLLQTKLSQIFSFSINLLQKILLNLDFNNPLTQDILIQSIKHSIPPPFPLFCKGLLSEYSIIDTFSTIKKLSTLIHLNILTDISSIPEIIIILNIWGWYYALIKNSFNNILSEKSTRILLTNQDIMMFESMIIECESKKNEIFEIIITTCDCITNNNIINYDSLKVLICRCINNEYSGDINGLKSYMQGFSNFLIKYSPLQKLQYWLSFPLAIISGFTTNNVFINSDAFKLISFVLLRNIFVEIHLSSENPIFPEKEFIPLVKSLKNYISNANGTYNEQSIALHFSSQHLGDIFPKSLKSFNFGICFVANVCELTESLICLSVQPVDNRDEINSLESTEQIDAVLREFSCVQKLENTELKKRRHAIISSLHQASQKLMLILDQQEN